MNTRRRDQEELTLMATETVPNTDTPLEGAIRELRAIRTFLPNIATVIDREHNTEAWQAVQGTMAQLDDCLTFLGAGPEEPTRVLVSHMDDVFATRDTIADDRRDDLMADADRSEYR